MAVRIPLVTPLAVEGPAKGDSPGKSYMGGETYLGVDTLGSGVTLYLVQGRMCFIDGDLSYSEVEMTPLCGGRCYQAFEHLKMLAQQIRFVRV